MFLAGWNEYFDEFEVEFRFDLAPRWLRLLSRTVLLERYAYPIALKRGFGYLWPLDDSRNSSIDASSHWIVMKSPKGVEERIFDGSLANLTKEYKAKNRVFNSLVIKISHGRFEFQDNFGFTREGRKWALRESVHTANGTLISFRMLQKSRSKGES